MLVKPENQLTPAEKSLLKYYNAAVENYVPELHPAEVDTSPDKKDEVLYNNFTGKVAFVDEGVTLHPISYVIIDNKLTDLITLRFSCYLVKDPSKEKAQALIRETLRVRSLISNSYKKQSANSTEKVTRITELDAFLAFHSKLLNTTFYP